MKTPLIVLSIALAAAGVTACNKSPSHSPGAEGPTTQNTAPAPAPSGGNNTSGNQQPQSGGGK